MTSVVINSLIASMLVISGPQSFGTAEQDMAETESAGPTNIASQKLSGQYYLRGVMETASGLQLSDDGNFQWYLSVGALDILTGGRWSVQEEQVILVFDPPKEGARYDPLGTVILKIDGDNLVPPDNMSGGVYVKTTPRPESE